MNSVNWLWLSIFSLFISSILGNTVIDEDDYLEEEEEDTQTMRNLYHVSKHQVAPIIVQPHRNEPHIEPQISSVYVETQKVVRELSCNFGAELIKNKCVERKFTPLQFVCPPHTNLVNSECQASHRPVVSCPDGFELQKNTCKICEVFPAELTCPTEDETLQGNECVREVESPPRCPPGFDLDSLEECTTTTPSMVQCPDGYVLDNKQCTRSMTFPANVVCPDGADLDPNLDKCFAIKQEPPRCPKKYTFCPNTGRCIQVVPEIIAPCPAGYLQTGSVCQQTMITPSDEHCPDEYSSDGEGACVRSVPVPAKCPSGFQHSRTNPNACEKIVLEIPKCPPDSNFQPESNLCERIVKTPIIEACPPGYDIIGGRCEHYEAIAPRLSCTNDCYRTRTSVIAYACSEDMEFQDDLDNPRCVERSSCGPLHAHCSKESALRASGERALSSIDPECASCQAKQEMIRAQPYCPEGGFAESNQCILREPVTPVQICDVGQLDPKMGKCIRTVVVPIKHECPIGSTRQGNVCVTRNKIHPDFVCPSGTETGPNGSCVVSVSAIELPLMVEKVPAFIRCNSGLLSENKKSCLQVQFLTAEMTCPPKAQRSEWNNNRCIMTTEMIVPLPVKKTVRSSYVCPDGTRSPGPKCYTKDVVSPQMVCPDNGELTSNEENCIKKVNVIRPPPRTLASIPVPVCPPEATAKGTNCISLKETPVNFTCGEGYFFHEKECIKYFSLQVVCPAGTMETPDGCLRETITAPYTKIVRGCTHIVQPTCTGCPRTVTSKCH